MFVEVLVFGHIQLFQYVGILDDKSGFLEIDKSINRRYIVPEVLFASFNNWVFTWLDDASEVEEVSEISQNGINTWNEGNSLLGIVAHIQILLNYASPKEVSCYSCNESSKGIKN